MQASTGAGIHKVMGGVTAMIKQNGLGSLWRGISPTLWRDVPFSAVYWFLYEETRKFFVSDSNALFRIKPEQEFVLSFTSGCVSGAVCSL